MSFSFNEADVCKAEGVRRCLGAVSLCCLSSGSRLAAVSTGRRICEFEHSSRTRFRASCKNYASQVRAWQCRGGRYCCLRAAALCPTAVWKKQQTSDRDKQEHMANCSVTLSCASYETVFCVIVHLEPSFAFASVQRALQNGKRSRGQVKNCSHELQMLVFTCGLVQKLIIKSHQHSDFFFFSLFFCSFWPQLN